MEETKSCITRKFKLHPAVADNKQWLGRVKKFASEKLADPKFKKEYKGFYQEALEAENANDVPMKVASDYTYDLVRRACESEARRKNYMLTCAFTAMQECEAAGLDKEASNACIKELFNSGFRVKGSSKGSLFDDVPIDNSLGSYGNGFNQDIVKKFWGAVKKGLMFGRVSLPTYKLDSPFTVKKAWFGLGSDYERYEELAEHWEEKPKLYFDFGASGAPTIARFRIDTGVGKNHRELMVTMQRLYSGEYECCGSSIQIDDKDIILNLSMKIPTEYAELDDETVVGVDLGIAIPAVCAVNNNKYARKSIGSIEDFLYVRKKIKSEKRRLQRHVTLSVSGGHGRKKKLKPLDRFSKYEANWAQTYNHNVSKQVVDFALRNRAAYINLENLEGFNDPKLLGSWSYFQLQSYIEYKAAMHGIKVRKIDPKYTSQTCSCCGNTDEEQRESQSVFKCRNQECKNFGVEVNADFNAARNIAMSTKFVK